MTTKLCLPAFVSAATAARLIGSGVLPANSVEILRPYAEGDVRDVTVAEAAKGAGISESTMRKRIQAGSVPAYRVPGTVQGSTAWRVQVVTPRAVETEEVTA